MFWAEEWEFRDQFSRLTGSETTPITTAIYHLHLPCQITTRMDPRVRDLYKRLLYICRDYPQGLNYARPKLKAGFMRHRESRGENVEKALEKGEFIYKEIEALIFLNRYRELKRRYYG